MWILNKTRSVIWNIWMVVAVLIISFVLLQTVNQMLEGAVGTSWLWVFVNTFPGLLIIQISIIRNRFPEKIITKGAHYAICFSTLFYLLLLVMTLLLEGWATQEQLSILAYRKLSFYWLLPFQLALLVSFYFFFFKNESSLNPSQNEVKNIAIEKANFWGKKNDGRKKEYYALISQGDLELVLKKLTEEISSLGNSNSLFQKLVSLNSRYADLIEKKMNELMTSEEIRVEKNKITFSIMNILK